jgi:hypothetical protein
MNKLSIYIFLLFLFSCKKSGDQRTLTYSSYNFLNHLISSNAARQVFDHKEKDRYELTITNDSGYRETIQIIEKGNKTYWYCDGKFILSHSLKTSDQTVSCYNKPPFLNSNIKLIRTKTYFIDNKKYEIFCYSEADSSDLEVTTYFVNDIGFICYCNLATNNYYLLSNVTGEKDIDSSNIKAIGNKLVNDTSFFIVHLRKKIPPIIFK